MAADAKKLIQAKDDAFSARSAYEADWREAEKFCLPHARKTGSKIYTTHGYRAARGLASGLYSNTYMPGRPWFSLIATGQADKVDAVKKWIAGLAEAALGAITLSNFGAEYYLFLLDAAVNGNGVIFTGFRDGALYFKAHRSVDVGYAFTTTGELDAVYREFELTPRQAMGEFPDMPEGLQVVAEYKRNPLSAQKFRFLHAVYRRAPGERKKGKKNAANMPFASVYVSLAEERVVKESGFSTMPYSVLRFYRTDSDYGTGPGVASLPDLRQLSSISGDFLGGLEMAISPPVFIPGNKGDHKVSMRAGAVNYLGAAAGDRPPVFAAPGANLQAAAAEMQTIRQQIDDEFFVSVLYQLALMAANNARTQMTAREVDERSDEKVLVLAPVVSRLFSESLNWIVTRVIDLVLANNLYPEPIPQGMSDFGPGLPASVKYLSRLDARINELMLRNVLDAGNAVAQLKALETQVPAVGDIMDFDKASREIVYALNVPADVIRGEQESRQRAESRAQVQAKMQAAAQASAMLKPIDTQRTAEPGSPLEKLQQQGGGLPGGAV